MNIVIVGAGRVGQTLAEKLARDGHDVSLIDSNSSKVRELAETLDARVIAGNGATAPELRRAGIEKANLVVAVTDRDEVNMVVGLLASFAFKVPRILVRLREADHAEGFDQIAQDHAGEHVWVHPVNGTFEQGSLRPGTYKLYYKKHIYEAVEGRRTAVDTNRDEIELSTVTIRPGETETVELDAPD